MTEREKMIWLWRNVSADLPDIYAIKGFRPNGCGPESWRSKYVNVLLNWLGGGVDLTPCGDLHDYRYWCGGYPEDRKRADDELYLSILAWLRCVSRWRLLLRARIRQRAMAYLAAVRTFGHEYFAYRHQ